MAPGRHAPTASARFFEQPDLGDIAEHFGEDQPGQARPDNRNARHEITSNVITLMGNLSSNHHSATWLIYALCSSSEKNV